MTVAVPAGHADNAAAVVAVALRVLVSAALAVDAIVHLRLASDYQLAAPGGIGQGNGFRIEAAVAVAVGLYVLFIGSRTAYGAAFLVAASLGRRARVPLRRRSSDRPHPVDVRAAVVLPEVTERRR
jgi:hypothetical protein